jgi:hypothetical protein
MKVGQSSARAPTPQATSHETSQCENGILFGILGGPRGSVMGGLPSIGTPTSTWWSESCQGGLLTVNSPPEADPPIAEHDTARVRDQGRSRVSTLPRWPAAECIAS